MNILEKLYNVRTIQFEINIFFKELCKYYMARSKTFANIANYKFGQHPWPYEFSHYNYEPYVSKEVEIIMKNISSSDHYGFKIPVDILLTNNEGDTSYWREKMKEVIIEEDLSRGFQPTIDIPDPSLFIDKMTLEIREAQQDLDLIKSYNPSMGEEKAQYRLDLLIALQKKMRKYPS